MKISLLSIGLSVLIATSAWAAAPLNSDLGVWCAKAGWEWSLDPVSGVGVARGRASEWRYREGGVYAMADGKLVRLAQPAYREKGRLMVPASGLPVKSEPLRQTRRILHLVLDPGHGGQDSGAISPFGTREKDLVLSVALAVRDALKARGLDVKMTRDTDVFIPLPDRAKMANSMKADLFVSIHANASPSRSLRGFEIYTLSEETDDTLLARQRAETPGQPVEGAVNINDKTLKSILWDMRGRENRRQSVKMAEQVSGRVAGFAPVEARRLKSANFHVLKNTECPSILIEIGYLTNRRDQTRLTSPKYRRSLVDGMVSGIMGFKREYEASDGFARAV